MSEIKDVAISQIDPNPYRDLPTFPWIERKIEQLQRSFKDVGVWEGVIARPNKTRFQTAFGHHRVEAARRNKLKDIPLIIRPLSEQQMLQFMGRENGEDYNADFLVMLNTWEAADKFLFADRQKKSQALDIARLLGWTAAVAAYDDQMNHTARACHYAAALIGGGYETRGRYEGMTVYQVESIAGAAFNRMHQVDKIGQQNKASARQIDNAKRDIAKAASYTADQAKKGAVAQRDLRAHVDVNTYRFARESKRTTPLFSQFGASVIGQIERMLNEDSVTERLAQIHKALPDIAEHSDKQIVQRIDLALEQLGDRAGDWRKKLTHPGKKIVPLAAISGRGA